MGEDYREISRLLTLHLPLGFSPWGPPRLCPRPGCLVSQDPMPGTMERDLLHTQPEKTPVSEEATITPPRVMSLKIVVANGVAAEVFNGGVIFYRISDFTGNDI